MLCPGHSWGPALKARCEALPSTETPVSGRISGSWLPAASPRTSRSPSLTGQPPSSRSAVANRPGSTARGGEFHITSSTTEDMFSCPLTRPDSQAVSLSTN